MIISLQRQGYPGPKQDQASGSGALIDRIGNPEVLNDIKDIKDASLHTSIFQSYCPAALLYFNALGVKPRLPTPLGSTNLASQISP